MEGTRTEPQYFSIFRSDEYVLKFHKNRRNETSPKGLVKRAVSVEKEIKYISNSFKKYAESVAKSCFSKTEIPDVVNSIAEQILSSF